MFEAATPPLMVKALGRVDYAATLEAMKLFTESRDQQTPDEVWLLEHPPTFTQGLAGKPEHILTPCSIPVVQVDRGGQITYHGPGQLVIYTLIDLARHNLKVRSFVRLLEEATLLTLAQMGIKAERQPGAPGIYIEGNKIASLGLKIKYGCSYHGLAINVDMDLTPFQQINPCGYPGLKIVQLRDFIPPPPLTEIGQCWVQHFKTLISDTAHRSALS